MFKNRNAEVTQKNGKGSESMSEVVLKPLYYNIKQIMQLESCGRDKAYKIAKELPHEIRGQTIYVFAEDYEIYYQQKRKKAKTVSNERGTNIFKIRRLSERG